MIALADCNNFYASCERVFNPALKNKPILVLSNNDGCIIARSNEAKKMGFQMGEPIFKKKEFIKKNKIEMFSSNFALYGDMSNRVMSILMEESPEIEIYSIDEAFLNLKGIREKERFVKKLREKVLKWTGIPISIGIGATKTLAKIANAKAKQKEEGIYSLKSKEDIKNILESKDVSSIWGIGNRTTIKLRYYGIKTAINFKNARPNFIKKVFSINMLKTQEELKGKKRYDINVNPETKKNICTSRSFSKEIKEYNKLKKRIISYSMRSAEKLRNQKGCAQTLTVFIQTNRFKETRYSNAKSIIFDVATNDSLEIVKKTVENLKKIYRPNYKYKKAGVVLGGIIAEQKIQMNLFDKINRIKRKELMNAIDKINYLNGKETIKIGTQGIKKYKSEKQQRLSPAYTTKWKEILNVK
tara:strand:+ start:10861 stop:12102 length:1242 start_codon:yes stop_codon:yes gene_type:complete